MMRCQDRKSEDGRNAPGGRPRAAVQALGCRLNLSEASEIESQFRAAGYALVPWGEEADVYLLNSCTVTGQADAKSRQALSRARKANPQARVAVTGCYAQTAAASLLEAGLADLAVGNADKENAVALIQQETSGAIIRRITGDEFTLPGATESPRLTRAHLKVQDGCDFVCSFCIIPRARGRARTRLMEDILAEAERLVWHGTREIVLSGVNLGLYDDGGKDLLQVVDRLGELPGLARLRISSIEPTTVPGGMMERMAASDHPLQPFLHLPLQSGDDGVLKAMRRRYTIAEYRAFVESALRQVPRLCLGTDVMAGFPGESPAAFANTLSFVGSLPFAYCHVFPYSRRAGTLATKMAEQIPPPELRSRAASLRMLGKGLRRAFQRQFIGEVTPVLFEATQDGERVSGYTPHYLRVTVHTKRAETLRNTILPVRILEAGDSGAAGILAEGPPR